MIILIELLKTRSIKIENVKRQILMPKTDSEIVLDLNESRNFQALNSIIFSEHFFCARCLQFLILKICFFSQAHQVYFGVQ